MANVFGFNYLYFLQQQILKNLSDSKDIVITAPHGSGVKSAILLHCISNQTKCIIFIRALDAISMTLSLLNVHGVKAEGITSQHSVNKRTKSIQNFVEGDLDFLLCTPDQAKLFNADHISALCKLERKIVIALFDSHRVFPESYQYNPCYSLTKNLIQSLYATSIETCGVKLISSVLVSDCLSSAELTDVSKFSIYPPTCLHKQRLLKSTVTSHLCHSVSSETSILRYLKRNSFQSVFVYTPTESVGRIKDLLTTHLPEIVLDVLPSKSDAINKFILVSSSPYVASMNNFDLVLINGLPHNISYLTHFFDSGVRVDIHYQVNDIEEHGRPFYDTDIEQQIKNWFGKPNSHEFDALNYDIKCLEALASTGHIITNRVKSKITTFRRSPLSSESSIASAIALANDRASKVANRLINLVESPKCVQERYNELLLAVEGIRCGRCKFCKAESLPLTRPDLPLSTSESSTLRIRLINYRNSLSTDLPVKVLLPDAALEQVIEVLPLTTKELSQLDSFNGNNRIELFGESILKIVNHFLCAL